MDEEKTSQVKSEDEIEQAKKERAHMLNAILSSPFKVSTYPFLIFTTY